MRPTFLGVMFFLLFVLYFAVAFVSQFLCFMPFWVSWNVHFSQNIGCLFKTPLKHCTQTIFQGGSPWAILIPNSVIGLRVLYCVQLFWSDFLKKKNVLLSFAVGFVSSESNLKSIQIRLNQLKSNWNPIFQLISNWFQFDCNWCFIEFISLQIIQTWESPQKVFKNCLGGALYTNQNLTLLHVYII